MKVQVAYASESLQTVIDLVVDNKATVQEAILQSGILKRYPHISLEEAMIGIFAERASLHTQLYPNARIEIYRPLVIDPKEARLLRVRRAAMKE